MPSPGLKYVHVNCRSLYRKLSQIDAIFKDSDFLCCSETWLSPAFSDALISLTDKTVYRMDRSARGGGVCIYIRTDISPYCQIDS